MSSMRFLPLAVLPLAFLLPASAETASQVFQQDSPSVVVVITYNTAGKPTELGSGVKLPNGSVATNCHVLKDGDQYRVRYQGKDYPALLHQSDWDRDVCALSVSGLPAPPVVLGNTRTLQVGANVYAIGTPEGLQLTLSEGIVSSLRSVGDGSYIQTTAAISPGSSGGGLFDDQGRLLGLTSFFVSNGQQLNFALPVEWIEALPQHTAARAVDDVSEVDWLNRATGLEKENDWHGMESLAEHWIQARPGSSTPWFALGEAFDNSGKHAQAINAYRKGLRISPTATGAWNNLGVAYNGAGEHAQAIDAYRHALQIDPRDAMTWRNLGRTYNEARQFAQAIEVLLKALDIDPLDANGWSDLGTAYAGTGQYAQGIEAYRHSLQINPKDAETWYNLGTSYTRARHYTQAIDAYRESLQIDPTILGAWTNLGAAYTGTGQYAQAIDAFRQALQINSQDSKAWLGLGLAYTGAGQKEEAIVVYQHLKTLDPAMAQTLFDIIVPK